MASTGFFGVSTRSSSKPIKVKTPPNTRARVCRASYAPSVYESYKTLRIERGASESDVKKAFRKLALQYHPDVCRGGNCDVKFHTISDAYDVVMSDLQDVESAERSYEYYDPDEPMRGMNDPDYDLWEEWMGWEGAGIRDYSSHINPYI